MVNYLKKGKGWILLGIMLVLVFGLVGCNTSDADSESNDKVITIGYQKNGPLIILKTLGTLEERLEKEGYTVEWKLFQAGPALLEALNAESIDFGRTGNTPPIFAQAADAPFIYLAAGYSKFLGSGILVHKDSPIQTLEDLKGKTIGFAKGSSSHYLLIKALEKAGIAYEDITPAYLQPGDARIAFEQGQIDAWVVWDPFASAAQVESDAKFLVNGEGLTTDRDFFVVTRQFAEGNEEILPVVLEEIEKSSKWANENHEELIPMIAEILGIKEEAIKVAVERREFGVEEITEDIIMEQQNIADIFYELDIIPKKLDVSEVMQ